MLSRPADDEGFTLVELAISIAILGIIFSTLTLVFVGSLRVNTETRARLDQTRDEQFVAVYMSDDIESMASVSAGAASRCRSASDPVGETAFVEFEGRSFDVATGSVSVTVVSYVFSSATSAGVTSGVVERRVCEAPLSPPPTYPLTPGQRFVVARSLAVSPPTVTCTAPASSDCNASTRAVAVTFTRLSSGDPFTIKGTRRTTP